MPQVKKESDNISKIVGSVNPKYTVKILSEEEVYKAKDEEIKKMLQEAETVDATISESDTVIEKETEEIESLNKDNIQLKDVKLVEPNTLKAGTIVLDDVVNDAINEIIEEDNNNIEELEDETEVKSDESHAEKGKRGRKPKK